MCRRKSVLDDVQTRALTGCGAPNCLRGTPPQLCAACNTWIIHQLLRELMRLV